MKIALYRDWDWPQKHQAALHILPALSLYVTGYRTEIQFSWLVWSLELWWGEQP